MPERRRKYDREFREGAVRDAGIVHGTDSGCPVRGGLASEVILNSARPPNVGLIAMGPEVAFR